MNDIANLRQQIATMQREHFREMADLRERIARLERGNRKTTGHVPEARQMVAEYQAKSGAA